MRNTVKRQKIVCFTASVPGLSPLRSKFLYCGLTYLGSMRLSRAERSVQIRFTVATFSYPAQPDSAE